MSTAHAKPLGGRILTPFMWVLLALVAMTAVIVIYRLFVGLGPVTAMTDGYPWGIWKPLNVVTFTGVGAGAYGMGLVVYIFNKGKYHSLVRPAVLVGALAYTLAGASVLVDLGRWWNFWQIPWVPWWNLNSVLLEVALCVLAYVGVLWVEVTPAILEKWRDGEHEGLKRLATRMLPPFEKALPWIIALALLLPTMHQSSLGSLYLLAVDKLHPLWHTGWIPFLFLVSCLVMGYGAVVVMANLLHTSFGVKRDQKMLAKVGVVAAGLSLVYVVVRLVDIIVAGRFGLILEFDAMSWLFLAEMALFLVPAVMLLMPSVQQKPGSTFGAALLMIAAGSAYRFDTYLTAFDPGPGWHYFPSVGETVVSVGLVAVGLAAFLFGVKKFPILSGVVRRRPETAAESRPASTIRVPSV